jgi:MtfA peptidase
MDIWPRTRIRNASLTAAGIGLATGAVGFMAAGPVGAAVAAVVGGAIAWFVGVRRYLARRKLVGQPLPEAWKRALERCVDVYPKLEGEARQRFEQDVRIFIAEQRIYGPRGAEVKDEIKVLIAASAAIMSHGMPGWEWPNLRDIVVYSTSFDEDYEVAGDNPIAGMVHAQGPIVFSARDLKHGFCKPHDGLNVGLHELAHVMDFATGAANGVPAGMEWVGTAPWIQVVAERLKKIRAGRNQTLRDYGGKNEAELFAVAVEAFFERPRRLRKRDPELYGMLAEFFGQDPAVRQEGSQPSPRP